MHHVFGCIDVKQYIFDHQSEELKQKLGDLNYDNSQCIVVNIEPESSYVENNFVNFHCVIDSYESSEEE